jgi:hypothetical protein
MKNDGKKKLFFAIKLIVIDAAIAVLFYFTLWRIFMVALRMLGVIVGFITLIAIEISVTEKLFAKSGNVLSERAKNVLMVLLIFVPITLFVVFWGLMMWAAIRF